MALTNFIKNDVQGSFAMNDDTATTPLDIAVSFDRGDFSGGPFMELLNEMVVMQRRGKFKSANVGPRVFPEFSFSCYIAQFTDGSAEILSDWILRNGAFSAAVSTLGTSHPIWTCDLDFTFEGTDYGDSADHTFSLEDCRLRIDTFQEASDGAFFACSGIVLGPVTGDLACAQVA